MLVLPEEKDAAQSRDIRENTYWGVAAYIGPLCLLTLLVRRKSPFARFHGRQGLVLFIAELIYGVVFTVLEALTRPILPLYIGMRCVWALVTLFLLTCVVLGVMHASKGEVAPMPLLGHILPEGRD